MDRSRLTKQRRGLYSRTPLIGSYIRRRAATGLAKAAQDGDQVAARDLAEVLTQPLSHTARPIAAEALRNLSNQSVINTVCTLWQWTRHEALSQLIVERGWIATGPAKLRMLTVLKTNQSRLLNEHGDGLVAALLGVCGDTDPVISRRATERLESLSTTEAIEDLCQAAYDGNERALKIAIRAGFLLGNVRQCVRYPQLAARISGRMSQSLKLRIADIQRNGRDEKTQPQRTRNLPKPCTIRVNSGTAVVTPRQGQSVESVLQEALRKQQNNRAV